MKAEVTIKNCRIVNSQVTYDGAIHISKGKIIGISVNTVEEAREAEHNGADYLGVGPLFFTSTKSDIRPPLGIQGLLKIRELVDIPILAIGGINTTNAGEVIKAGADGVAVISAILNSGDITKATKELVDVL